MSTCPSLQGRTGEDDSTRCFDTSPANARDGEASPNEMRLTFFPPLHDARRAWILRKLRQEHVSSVLDIGCGEGSLLSCLCNPPAFLCPDKNLEKGENPTPSYTSACDGLPDLHISRLVGLDICKPALEECIAATAPPPVDLNYQGLPRWESLEVKLWLGSLDVYNAEFVDVECIVSMEVIEHLPASILPAFAPTLLGLYRPRLLLITTPNYTFNARFSAPGTVDLAGIPDPTQRTDRVFRHYDHKFEWTPAEFSAWCTDAARAWGYSVEIDAIGLPNEPDPWRRDAELGCASQVALFRRMDEWGGQGSSPSLSEREECAHELVMTHIHPPHPQAGAPRSHETVRELVSNYMQSYYFADGYSIWDLWVENSISAACGGRLDVLLSAIDASPGLSVSRAEGVHAREWNVKFAGGKHQEAVEASRKTRGWKTESPQSPWRHEGDGIRPGGGLVDANSSSSWPQMLHNWSEEAPVISVEDAETGWGAADMWDTEKPLSGGWG